jgi:glutamine synthetase
VVLLSAQFSASGCRGSTARGRTQVFSAFEQEFVYTGVNARPGTTYGYDAYHHQGPFGEAFISAIRRAGVKPDSFLPEYVPRQYEVTVAPTAGVRAAEEAVIVREMARAVAFRHGHRVTFTPVVDLDVVGNGTHIHFSLWDAAGQPVKRALESQPDGLRMARPRISRYPLPIAAAADFIALELCCPRERQPLSSSSGRSCFSDYGTLRLLGD